MPLTLEPTGECRYCGAPIETGFLCAGCDRTAKERQDAEGRRRRLVRLGQRNVRPEVASGDWNFGTFEALHSTQKATLEAMRAWAAGDLPVPWLYVHGPIGTGKTILSQIAFTERFELERAESYADGCVKNWDLLVAELQATFSDREKSEYRALLRYSEELDLLVVDDLGVRDFTPYSVAKLYDVVNGRYERRAPTIWTSNRDLGELAERIALKTDRLEAERILSRLTDKRMTLTRSCEGPSHRRKA